MIVLLSNPLGIWLIFAVLMGPRKLAVVDLGTNTFHLVIAEMVANDLGVVYKEKFPVLLGAGGINKATITSEAEERALSTLTLIKSKLNEFEVDDPHIFATSALRTAANSEDVIAKFEKELGGKLKVLSGKEEAGYIYQGVKKAVDLGGNTSLIMDIGGGSVEFMIGNCSEVQWLESYEIGAQRLLDLFHRHDPITKSEIDQINSYLKGKLQSLVQAIEKYRPTVLVGSSGTFDTLSEIYRLKNNLPQSDSSELPLKLSTFGTMYEEVLSKDRAARMAIPGMIEMRVEMIVVAAILINFVISNVQFDDLRVSSFALKEGLLFSIANENQ